MKVKVNTYNLDGRDFGDERARGGGRLRALVRLDRELVLLLARDAVIHSALLRTRALRDDRGFTL